MPLPWEVPEIAALTILLAIGVVIVGGLAAGIDVASARQGPFLNSLESTWDAVQFGASWAEPLLAVVLLGVVGLCWWQVDTWGEASLEPAAAGYVRRARRLSAWALGGLGITTVGAVAGLVAAIGLGAPAHPGALSWTRVIGIGAGAIAVLIVAVGGFVIVRRISASGQR